MTWPMVRLGDVCEVRAGRDYKDVEASDGAYPIYGTGGVMGRSVEARCPENSVIVGRKGTLNNPMLVREPFWNIDTCFGVIPDNHMLPEYLWRFCQNFDFYQLVPASGRPSTTSDAIKAINIPLPPLAEQKKIVARLEKDLARVEKAQAEFARVKSAAEAYFKAALAEAFDGIKGEKVRLGEICDEITDGDHQPPPKVKQGIPFLVISNVASGVIDFNKTRFVPQKYYDEIANSRKPRIGDVLLTVTGSYGIPVLVKTDRSFCFQRHIALLRATRMLPEFLSYLMLCSRPYFDRVATGAAQKTVSLSSLRNMLVVEPPLSVQRSIVARLDAAKERSEALVAVAERGLAVCAKMRKAILSEAFANE